jgi:hypothetical protein
LLSFQAIAIHLAKQLLKFAQILGLCPNFLFAKVRQQTNAVITFHVSVSSDGGGRFGAGRADGARERHHPIRLHLRR